MHLIAMELRPGAGPELPPLHVSDALYARQLEAINEVARIANLDLQLRPMLQRITDALAQKFDWEFVALVFVDEERTHFVCEAVTASEPTEIHAGYSRPLGSGVVGEVALTELPIVLDDVRTSANYVETMPGAMSELCVPVKHGGRVVAILNLESRRVAAFHEQLPLLQTVADQVAGAIANARHYEELQQRARLMEMMSDVSRSALEATDLGEVLARIVKYIREQFAVPFAEIALRDRSARDGEQSPQNASLQVSVRFRSEQLGVLTIESPTAELFTPAHVTTFELFAAQVAGAIRLTSMKDALEAANAHLSSAIETLHRISTTDPLTGAANRRQFDDALSLEWRRAARTKTPLSLLMIDVDCFKAFNDAHGHQAGDECLRRVAESLQSRVHRAGDLVARYGGEEFAVLLAGVSASHARELADRARGAVAELAIAHATSVAAPYVTISVGVATVVPDRDGAPESLVRAADEALYAAKNAGRNRVSAA